MVKVLFVDEDNGLLSQIASAYLQRIGSRIFEAKSAGINAGVLNSNMLHVMEEKRFSVNQLFTKSIHYFIRKEERFAYIISFLPKTRTDQSHLLPPADSIEYWNLKDLQGFEGTDKEMEKHIHRLFDLIRSEVRIFIRNHMEKNSKAEAVFQT